MKEEHIKYPEEPDFETIHKRMCEDWVARTAWEGAMSGDFSQTGSHHTRDVVDVESISRERHEKMLSQNCL